MQPTIKAYDSSTWVLDDMVGSASSYKYDAYGYGVYYDTVHGDISAMNPLLINKILIAQHLVTIRHGFLHGSRVTAYIWLRRMSV
jgi:hypothetical protein